jgi:hypothetical protein
LTIRSLGDALGECRVPLLRYGFEIQHPEEELFFQLDRFGFVPE